MKKRICSLIPVLVFIFAFLSGLQPTVFGMTPPINQEKLPPPGSRLLVIAPHCDDETLGAGVLLHEAVKKGYQVKVVVVTNGDGYAFAVDRDLFTLHPTPKEFVRFGMRRQEESVNALRTLGVPQQDIVFLGFPDKGIMHLWSEYWDADECYYSRYTGTSTNPYPNTFEYQVPYNGVSLLKDLGKIVDDFHPTDIYYPHPNDLHPDHWAVSAFVRYLIEEKDLNHLQQHLYIIHHGKWPTPKFSHPSMPLTPPTPLINTGTFWRRFEFSPQEAELKAAAILQYKTQVRVMRGFLLSFVRKSELFGSLPDYQMPLFIGPVEAAQNSRETPAIKGPVANALTLNADKSADIKEVASYIEDNQWIIEIHTVAPVKPKIIYEVHARLFTEQNSVSRLDFQLKQSKIYWRSFASNSLTDLQEVSARIEHGCYKIVIPLSVIPKSKSVFMSVDSLYDRYMLDKTAWRMLRFPELIESND